MVALLELDAGQKGKRAASQKGEWRELRGEMENGPGLNGSSTRLIFQKPGFCEKPGFLLAVSHVMRSPVMTVNTGSGLSHRVGRSPWASLNRFAAWS
jgi:hypothetical protein